MKHILSINESMGGSNLIYDAYKMQLKKIATTLHDKIKEHLKKDDVIFFNLYYDEDEMEVYCEWGDLNTDNANDKVQNDFIPKLFGRNAVMENSPSFPFVLFLDDSPYLEVFVTKKDLQIQLSESRHGGMWYSLKKDELDLSFENYFDISDYQ